MNSETIPSLDSLGNGAQTIITILLFAGVLYGLGVGTKKGYGLLKKANWPLTGLWGMAGYFSVLIHMNCISNSPDSTGLLKSAGFSLIPLGIASVVTMIRSGVKAAWRRDFRQVKKTATALTDELNKRDVIWCTDKCSSLTSAVKKMDETY